MNAIAQTTASPLVTQGMGIQEIEAAVQAGALTAQAAFAIVEQRIAARTARNRPQIARVVEYRNQLAAQLGHAAMPVPQYTAKPAPPSAASPAFPSYLTVEQAADALVLAGFDIPALMTALAQRISTQAKTA